MRGNSQSLRLRPLSDWNPKRLFCQSRHRSCPRRSIVRCGDAEAPQKMRFSSELFERKRHSGAVLECKRLRQFKYGVMCLPHCWVNTPARGRITVNGLLGCVVRLIKISRGP